MHRMVIINDHGIFIEMASLQLSLLLLQVMAYIIILSKMFRMMHNHHMQKANNTSVTQEGSQSQYTGIVGNMK